MNAERRLRECLVRVVEALVDGNPGHALHIAQIGLEVDVKGVRCPDCGIKLRWAGDLDHHQRFVHWREAA